MSRPTQYGGGVGGDGVLVEWGTGLAHPAENREEINEGIAIGGAAYNKVSSQTISYIMAAACHDVGRTR